MAESITNSAKTVGTTAVQLYAGASRLESVTVSNVGPATIYLGSSTVTTANGVPLPAGATVNYTRDRSDSPLLALDRYAIAGVAGNDVRVEEVKA